MKKILPSAIIVICLFVTGNIFAQTASDFLPPASGGKTTPNKSNIVATETDVKEKTAVVIAKTMQDGAAISAEIMTTDEFDPPTITTVILLSGKKARFATGSSTMIDLDKLKNEDQKRDALRDTTMRAYTDALANLTKALSDKTVAESTVAMTDKVRSKVGETVNRNNLRTLTEKARENFNGTCRPRIWGATQNDDGLIEVTVYHLEDDRDATPINAGNDIFAACLQTEYNKIKTGFLLPEGGEIYQNTKNGEYCYIGYANAVIYHSEDRDDQAELTLDAKKIATMRAQTALLGIMNGKGCKRIGSLEGSATRRKGSLDGITGNIPEGFNTTQETSTVTDIEVRGKLPPDIEVRTIKVPSGNYYYAFVMYKTKRPVDPINAKLNNR